MRDFGSVVTFDLRASGDGWGPSDHAVFFATRHPVLHFFTDLHDDYHRSTDYWDKINAPGMVRVAEFATGIVTAIANRPVALTFIDVPPPTPKPGVASTPGYGAYLGTIPHMASGDIGGVRITGVTKGSPAELAGLKGGDIITRIGEHQVPDLVGMTDALRAHRAGDKVEIVVLRDGVEQHLPVTLGKRGG
jgi:membrane-associated protease RseP (regulator of RpoE activity)